MVGTYAFQERGSSSIVDLTTTPAPPIPPFHWNAAIAPFVTLGELTFSLDGTVTGFYWIRSGSLNGGSDRIELQNAKATVDSDCTGTLTYDVVLNNLPTVTIEERVILFDEGREFRSIPISISGGDPTLAWTGVGHRIGKGGESASTCGPETANGNYVMTAENLIPSPVDPNTAFTDSILFRMDIAMTGEYTGTLYEKLGPFGGINLPIWGTFNVNSDCSYSWELKFKIDPNGPTFTVHIQGVLFDHGKELYGLAVDQDIAFSTLQGERVSK
jgi:hypothetical protein